MVLFMAVYYWVNCSNHTHAVLKKTSVRYRDSVMPYQLNLLGLLKAFWKGGLARDGRA